MAELRAHRPSLRDQIAWFFANQVGGLGADKYRQQYVAKKVGGLLDFVPGVGEAVGIDEAKSDYDAGNYGMAAAGLGLTAAGALPVVGDVASKALKGAAIRIDGKLFSGKTHNDAIAAAEESLGHPVFRDYVDQGFLNHRGRFISRDDPKAALDALSAGQIKDPVFRQLVEASIKRGEHSPLIAEMLDFGPSASPN